MNKKKGLIIGIIAFVLLVAIACTAIFLWPKEQEESILPAEGAYSPNYENFPYPHSADVTIDGELDEEIWQDQKWYVNTTVDNIDGRKPTLNVTATMDQYGIYIASKTQDTNVVDESGNTTAWEFWVAAGNLEDSANINQFKFKVDISGAIETSSMEVPRAVKVIGNVGSGETEGAVVEMFIPWQALGVDSDGDMPEEFRIFPSYYAFFGMSQTELTISPVQSSSSTVLDYFRFNADGYMSADREGAVVGDTIYGYGKNAGFDVSKEAEGILQSSYGTEHHRIFFKEYGSDFLIEATITPVGSIQNAWPKAGISFMTSDFVYHSALLEFHDSNIIDGINGTKTAKDISLCILDNHNGNWNQSGFGFYPTNTAAKTQEGLKLTVLKSGGRLWYFVNDAYFASEEVDYMDTDVVPGLHTLGCDAVYTDYSCKAVTDDDVAAYLAEHSVYPIYLEVGAGGTATASKISIIDGESYDLEIVTKSGYEVASVLINGEERIEDAKKNAKNGVYTVKGAKGEQNITITFAKTTEATVSGMLTDSETGNGITATVHIYGIDNGVLHYEVNATENKGYKCVLPKGTYRVAIQADGYMYMEKNIEVTGENTLDFQLVPSAFAGSVSVNGGTAYSQMYKWDMTQEANGKILSSYDMGGKMAPLFFKGTGSDFVVSTTIKYTTNFIGNQDQYQWDLMGGFVFNNGSTEGWVFARQTGLVKNGWKYVMNLVEQEMLICPTKNDAKLTVAKLGDDVYFYLNGRCVNVDKWTTFCPGMSADEDVAIGLYNCMDKTSDIQYSNYSLIWDAEVVAEYIANHPYGDYNVANSPFAESLTVNGNRLVSHISRWDLSHVKEGYVLGSYALDTQWDPLYFSKNSSDFAVEATFEYDLSLPHEQWDLFGGFTFHNGTQEGWTLMNSDGLVCTGWNYSYKPLVNYPVLRTDGEGPTKLALVKKGSTVYIYFDDLLVKQADWKTISGGISSSDSVAVGLMMNTDNPSTLKVSDYAIYTGTSAAQKYLNEHTNVLQTYSISYVLDGGKNPSDAPTSYTTMNAWTISLPTPTKEGYIFMGWYNGQDQVSALTDQEGNITLTAKWVSESELQLDPFAARVTIGKNTVNSQVHKWDISHLEDGYVVGSYDMGTGWNGLYFAETANDFAVEAIFEYDMTQPHEQWDLLGGFIFNSGSQEGWALMNSDGLICTGWNYSYKPLVDYAILRTDSAMSTKLAIVKQGDTVTFFIDDVQVGTGSWDTLSGGISATAEVAIGLVMNTDKAATLKISEYNLYAGTEAAAAYIETQNQLVEVKTLTHSGSTGCEKVMLSDTRATGFTVTVDLEQISGSDIGFVLSDGTNNMTLTFMDSPWGMIPAVDGNIAVVDKDSNGTKLVAYRDPSLELRYNGKDAIRPLYNGETAISEVDYSRGACPTLSADGERRITLTYNNGYITVYDAGWGQCIYTYYMRDVLGMDQFRNFTLDWKNGLTVGLAVIDSSVNYSNVKYRTITVDETVEEPEEPIVNVVDPVEPTEAELTHSGSTGYEKVMLSEDEAIEFTLTATITRLSGEDIGFILSDGTNNVTLTFMGTPWGMIPAAEANISAVDKNNNPTKLVAYRDPNMEIDQNGTTVTRTLYDGETASTNANDTCRGVCPNMNDGGTWTVTLTYKNGLITISEASMGQCIYTYYIADILQMRQFSGFSLDWESGLTVGLVVQNASITYCDVAYSEIEAEPVEGELTHSGTTGYEKLMLSEDRTTSFELVTDLEWVSGNDIGFVLGDGTNNMTLTFFDSPWGMIPAVNGNISAVNKDTNGTKLVAYRDPSRELDKNGTTVTRPLYNGETAISAVDYSRGACPTLSADGKRTVTVKYSNGYITVYDAGWGQCIWTYYMGDILGMKQFNGFDMDWENGLTIGLAVINSSVKYSNVSYTDHNADTGEQVETLTHSGSGYEKAMLSAERATGFTLTVDLEHISGKDIGFVLSDGTNNMTLTFFDSPWGMIPAVNGNISAVNKDTNGTKLVAYRDPSRELDKNGTTVTRPLYNGETAISAVDYSRGACPTLSADGKRTVTVKYSNGYITVYDAGWGQCIWTYYMGDILGMKQFNGFDMDWENGLTIGLAVIDSSVKYSEVSYTEE